MTLYDFMSEIWKMIKDYLGLILGTIIVVIIASFGFQYLVSMLDTDTATENGVDQIEDDTLNQVGTISLYADSDFENIRLDPELHPELIEEISLMEGFSTDFAVNTNTEDEEFNESGDGPIIDLDSFETANILELLLGIDSTQQTQVFQDPDTGNLLMSLEIDANSGDIRLTEANNATDVIEVQLDVSDDSETGNFDFPSTDADLMNIGWDFTPDGDRLMRFSAVYDLISGMNYPIQLNDNRRNITVANPTELSPLISTSQDVFNLRSIVIQFVLTTFGGALLGTGIAFVLALLSNTIKYSFTYGWNSDELFLKFDEKDSAKLIAHDMLVSNKNNIAIVSESQINEAIVKKLTDTSKKVDIYSSIEQLDVSDNVEEIILVVQRNMTTKEWYRKQRKHIRAYRDIGVKITEL